MRTRVTHILPLILVLFLAVLTLWLQYIVQMGSETEAVPVRHEPDGIIENFTINRLDDAGKVRYTLSAPKMQHFPDDDSGEVLYPRIVSKSADGGDLVATANRAVINREGEEAFLYGNVLIVREGTAVQEPFQASTEFLHVFGDKGIATTDRAVTVTQGASKLTGVGMIVYKDKQQFALQSEVKGTFDVPKKK
jgi:lipopolysaccharide export system protein LptC